MLALVRCLGTRRLAFSTLLAVLAGGLNAALVALLLKAVREPSVGLTVALGVLMVALAVSRAAATHVLAVAAEAMTLEFRTELLEDLGQAQLSEVEQMGDTPLRRLASRDSAQVSFGVAMAPFLLMNALLVVGVLVLLFVSNWRVGAIFVVGVVIGGALVGKLQARFVERMQKGAELLDQADTLLSKQIANAGALKLNARRLEGAKRATRSLWTEVQGHRVGARAIGALLQGSTTMLVFSVIILVLALREPLSVSGAEVMSFGFLAVFLTGPVEAVTGSAQALAEAVAAFNRIEALRQRLAVVEEPKSTENGAHDYTAFQEIQMEGVSYVYPEFTLGPVNLTVKRGETTFLVGGNGSGKSTFLKVIMGLYRPHKGSVRVDGDVVETTSAAYRELFAYVPFDFTLFETLYGRGSHQEPAVRAQLQWFEIGGKLDARVEADAIRWSSLELSQGQRRRLALIDAITEGKPILVLDECASDQDPHFRERFYRELLPHLKGTGVTLIIVSHDDRYYDLADRMLKLEGGKSVSAAGAASVPRPPPPVARSLTRRTNS